MSCGHFTSTVDMVYCIRQSILNSAKTAIEDLNTTVAVSPIVTIRTDTTPSPLHHSIPEKDGQHSSHETDTDTPNGIAPPVDSTSTPNSDQTSNSRVKYHSQSGTSYKVPFTCKIPGSHRLIHKSNLKRIELKAEKYDNLVR